MYHDITDGVSAGWTILFTVNYTARGPKCLVSARSPTNRIMRSPRDVAKIFPVQDWPVFAQECLNQQVKDDTKDEGLF